MNLTRRHFLKTCAAVAVGFSGLQRLLSLPVDAFADARLLEAGYGPLLPDPDRILDLPEGFSYRIVSRAGDEMADGLILPGMPDAMGAFAAPDGRTIVVRNHEQLPSHLSPFGSENERMGRVPTKKIYDIGFGMTPSTGGTTTFVYDTRAHRLDTEFLSLVGTMRNCAGGPTPWNTWISCEEFSVRAGHNERWGFYASVDHGYNFEVPATTTPQLAEAVPLKAMGRFIHEAVAVDPRTGIVYQTEDRPDGLIYRFLPDRPGDLGAGGRLQAMCMADRRGADMRNWPESTETIEVGRPYAVHWIDLDDVESPEDDLRHRGVDLGACHFSRGEGMWAGTDEIYFAATDGGRKQIGQIWRYRPGSNEGQANEGMDAGQIELFIEPNDSALVQNADNLTIAPWGDLVVCEDCEAGADNRLICVTPKGTCYTLGKNHVNTEFAGVVFSPDGSTLFINLQDSGLTLAITGPWRAS